MSQTISHDSEKPAPGQQVFTACAFIHKKVEEKEKVFLPRRAATKKFLPNVFELPGGHVDFGEDMIRGLKREIEEEFNMQIEVGDPFCVFTYTNAIKGSHSIEVIYFAKFTSLETNLTLHPEDHSEFRWIGEDEIHTIESENKRAGDPEIEAIKKGFKLLQGQQLNFG